MTALRPRGALQAAAGSAAGVAIAAACARCLRDYPDRFVVAPQPTGVPGGSAISVWPHASELIDVVGWVALYRTLIEQSWQEPDRRAARRLAVEAGMCLDEALKFYPLGERYPREESFFTAQSRERFRAYRGQFERDVVLDHRRRSPIPAATESWDGGWKFWEKHIEPRTGWRPDHG